MKKHLGRSRHSEEENIQLNFKEIEWKDMHQVA